MTSIGWKYWTLAALTVVMAALAPGTAAAVSKCNPATNPDCDPPPPPPPPPPPTSLPDLSMQISPCLADANQRQFMVNRIKTDVSRALRQLDLLHDDPAPNPDVRTRCAGTIESIATWFLPVGGYGGSDTAAARDRGLAQVSLLAAGEGFGARVSASGLRRLIDVAWRDVPKRMNDAGQADPNGNTHLTSIGSTYNPTAKQVTTTINGFYDGPASDTNFWISVYDHLGLTNGDVTCVTSIDSGHDTTIDTILAAIGSVFGIGDGVPDPSAPSFLRAGPACQAAASAPSQILIPKSLAPVPQALKEVFKYSRLNVNGSGIEMAGSHDVVLRQLKAVISGQYHIEVEPGTETNAQFFALPFDLRAPVRAVWSAPGATISVLNQSRDGELVGIGTTAFITWPTQNLREGQTATFNIGLTLTDADGFSASTTATIRVVAKSQHEPPICQSIAHLPQCQ